MPLSVCKPSSRICTLWTWIHVPIPALLRCVGFVHVPVRLWTWIQEPVPPLCLCLGTNTPLDEYPRACTCPFRCVGRVHVHVGFSTCIHVPVPAIPSCLQASRRASTCLYLVCSFSLRATTPLDEYPRACTGNFRRVGLVHVPLGL